jgi:hypothetical protein
MPKKLLAYMLIAIFLYSILVPTTVSQDESTWWDTKWSFRKKINITIDTSSEQAKFQPVDIFIQFEDPCWAKDENEHSIRVVSWDGKQNHELESQVYDLDYNSSQENIIDGCNLVFLIPVEANGMEEYYIYYDDGMKSTPEGYEDHIDIKESYYKYEYLPGMNFEAWFYMITQGDYLVYNIVQKGVVRDIPVSQQVVKLKPGSKEPIPKNGEHAALFDFRYWWDVNDICHRSSTSEELIDKEILVDGNLMVKCAIVSGSKDGLLKTTAFYKYYFCPTEDKRIYIHVKHEFQNYPLPPGNNIDVGYAMINCGKIRSSIIEDLNIGDIPPYLYFYSDEEHVVSRNLDTDPEGSHWQSIIGREDNCDLGSNPWVTVGYGETGNAQAIIFESNKLVKSDNEERDGIQLQLYESNYINLPGLDGSFADVYCLQDIYEPGEETRYIIPEDFVVEFNAEFFSTENGGYKVVEQEAEIYRSLIRYQPTDDDIIDGDEDEEKHTLTAYVHLPLSILVRMGFSNLLLKNTYISAEIINENYFIKERVSRISISNDMRIDWENTTLLRKARFQNLKSGKYVVKIFLENPLLDHNHKFIGVTVVDLIQDANIHISCKPEGKIKLSFLNQEEDGIENVETIIFKDDTIIANNYSDSTGETLIGVPSGLGNKYLLKSVYKGFLIQNEEIRLISINEIFPMEKTMVFDVHSLNINIMDSDGKIPDFDVDISLTSDEMQYPVTLKTDSVSKGEYKFLNLYPANYTLKIIYNSFKIEERINIPEINSMTINLYKFSLEIKDNWNLPIEANLDISLISNDFEEPIVLLGSHYTNGVYGFSNLYPGNYSIKIIYKSFKMEKFFIIPNNNGMTTIIFPAIFNVTAEILDSHGSPLKDAIVVISRGDKEIQGVTNNRGTVLFSLPPGTYISKVYTDSSEGDAISKRKVDVLGEKKYTVVTTNEPLIPFIIIGLSIVILIGGVIYCNRKKDAFYFLKILAIVFAVIAIITPWWTINGSNSNPKIETSTNMFLLPTEMVSITSSDEVVAGEIALLDGTFESAMNILSILIFGGFICVIISIFLKRYDKTKLSFFIFIIGLLIFLGSIVLYYYAMSEFAEATVGSLIGNGDLDISIPGEGIYETLSCNWGPSIGFYFVIASTVILIGILSFNLKNIYLKWRKIDL